MTMPEPPAYGGVPQWPFSAPDAVMWGWNKFRYFLGPVLIGVGLYVAVTVVSTMAGGFISVGLTVAGIQSGNPDLFRAVDAANRGLIQLATTVGQMILGGAAMRAALDVADGRQYDFFNALRRIPILKLVGAQLLIGIAFTAAAGLIIGAGFWAYFTLHAPIWILVAAGVMLIIPPAIVIGFLLMFFAWELVDDPSTRIGDAIRSSAALVRGNLANSIYLALLSALVMFAGFLACCVGMLVAYPVIVFATANAYRRFQGRSVAL